MASLLVRKDVGTHAWKDSDNIIIHTTLVCRPTTSYIANTSYIDTVHDVVLCTHYGVLFTPWYNTRYISYTLYHAYILYISYFT